MKMNKWIVPVIMLVFVMASCTSNSPDFTVTKSGLGYKIFSGKGKDSIKPGNFIRFRAVQKIEDSLLSIPDETPDQFIPVDSIVRPFDLLEIINKLAVGDSVVYRFPVDTLFALNPTVDPRQFPPYFKKGKNIYVYLKLREKYDSFQHAESDVRVEMERINRYLTEKKNKEFDKLAKEKYQGAVKTQNGTLVKILQQGDGPQCDSGKVVNIKYEGRLVDGTVFDGNMKPMADGNTRPPLEFQLGVYPVIPGWVEGLKQLKKGAKAQFFIPWSAAYGPQGNQGVIPPYSNLVFDIEVADVKDASAAPPAPVIPGQPKQ
jgi:FKBP-type peptidyl-prolyl cis-trans isomerase FkpA